MAAAATPNSENISIVLECPVCMEKFTDPRMLPCGHTFCRSCIEDLVVRLVAFLGLEGLKILEISQDLIHYLDTSGYFHGKNILEIFQLIFCTYLTIQGKSTCSMPNVSARTYSAANKFASQLFGQAATRFGTCRKYTKANNN